MAGDYEFLVLYTSTPSFANDVKVAEAFKERPGLVDRFLRRACCRNNKVAIKASPVIDFVCDAEFDFTIKEIAEGKPLEEVVGITILKDGEPHFTGQRPIIEDMDSLPWVTKVYKRDLVTTDYYNGYMLHPYMSLYTGRGCKSRCTFCLWPQTISGHRYRFRSIENVVGEIKWARDNFPEIKEFFFDDDTLTDNKENVEALARELGKLGVTCLGNAKANVPYETLKIMKDNDCVCSSVTSPVIRRSCTTLKRVFWSRRRDSSPAIATNWASLSMAPSFLVCRVRPRKPLKRRSNTHRSLIRRRFRYRSQQLIPALSCTIRPWRMAG